MRRIVLTLGDLVVDQTLEIAGFPLLAGQHQQITASRLNPGGAANTLIMGARLGLQMRALGTVGQDIPGEVLLNALSSEGVDINAVLRLPTVETRVVYCLVAPSGEHVFLGQLGGSAPDTLPDQWAHEIASAGVLFFDGWNYRTGYANMCLRAAELARVHEVPVFFDPGPEISHFDDDWLDRVLQNTHTLLLTEDELRTLLKEDRPTEEAASQLLTKIGIKQVVVKRGEHGSTLITTNGVFHHQGYSVQVRDTTGAGDGLAAAIIAAFLWSLPPQFALSLANAVGAAAVTKLGAGLNMPTLDEVRSMLGHEASILNNRF
jgi:sugar/nucleoside kinase (ribokinase family)